MGAHLYLLYGAFLPSVLAIEAHHPVVLVHGQRAVVHVRMTMQKQVRVHALLSWRTSGWAYKGFQQCKFSGAALCRLRPLVTMLVEVRAAT